MFMLCSPVMEQSSISKFPDGAMEGKRRQQCQSKTIGKTALINILAIKTMPSWTLIIIVYVLLLNVTSIEPYYVPGTMLTV